MRATLTRSCTWWWSWPTEPDLYCRDTEGTRWSDDEAHEGLALDQGVLTQHVAALLASGCASDGRTDVLKATLRAVELREMRATRFVSRDLSPPDRSTPNPATI